MASLITCPGCKNKLTVPDDFTATRAQCPRCQIEFVPEASPLPDLAVDTPEVKPTTSAAPTAPPPPVQTGYVPRDRMPAPTVAPGFYCVVCGTRVARSDEACANCGCPIQIPRGDDDWRPRSPRPLPPYRGSLAFIAIFLVPVGLLLMLGVPILAEVFRRNPFPSIFLFLIASSMLLTALGFSIAWLYQAWRVVIRDDEEYSPGLMVGLLFIPFFNFYWIFRAVPGLSRAIHIELRRLDPMRASSSGWVPGLVACIFALVPYGQPVAMCVFLAWMLIVNNAIQRLIRLNEKLLVDKSDAEDMR